MSSGLRWQLSAVLACVVAFSSGRAGADEPLARKLYSEGEAAFSAGRFVEAAQRFEECWSESRRVELLWNIAQAYRRQFALDGNRAHLDRACTVLHNYAELVGPPHRQEADEALRSCERQQGALSRDPRRETESSKSSRTPGFALLGAGGGVALVGLGFGLGARSEAATVSQTGSVQQPAPFARVASDESRGQIYQTISYVLYGVGAATALVGVVLELIPQRRSSSLRANAQGLQWTF